MITSAGLVLAGDLRVLATLPLIFLAEIGFLVAFGVLLDTIIVRSVLVTGLNLDFGRHIWWPARISRREHEDQFGEPDESRERKQSRRVGALQSGLVHKSWSRARCRLSVQTSGC